MYGKHLDNQYLVLNLTLPRFGYALQGCLLNLPHHPLRLLSNDLTFIFAKLVVGLFSSFITYCGAGRFDAPLLLPFD